MSIKPINAKNSLNHILPVNENRIKQAQNKSMLALTLELI